MTEARLIKRGTNQSLHLRKGLPLDRAIIATTYPDDCFDAAERLAWRQVRAAARWSTPVCRHGGRVAIAGDPDLLEAALVALRPASQAALVSMKSTWTAS